MHSLRLSLLRLAQTYMPCALAGLMLLVACLSRAGAEEIVVWSDSFDDGRGDDRWYAENGVWQMGAPTIGPETNAWGFRTFSGTNCATTGLDVEYPPFSDTRLIRIASFLVPEANQFPRLRFWHWYEFGFLGFGIVEIREVGATNSSWTSVSPYYYGNGSAVWTRPSLDLQPFAGKSVQVAFRLSYQASFFQPQSGRGWYLDDIQLLTGAPTFKNHEGFEMGLGDWSVETGTWEVGTPAFGPPTNHLGQRSFFGTNCAVTALGGAYAPYATSRLISPPLVVPAEQYPRLRFWHWYEFGFLGFGSVEIRELGETNSDWSQLSPLYFGHCSGVWTRSLLELRHYAGKTVQVSFSLDSQESNFSPQGGPGWYVDDIAVEAGSPIFNNPERFESGLGDWSVETGTWEVGVPTSGPVPNSLGQRAFSGTNSAATVLGGDYYAYANSRLISPEFIVPVAASNPGLRYRHWYDFGFLGYGVVEIKVGTNDWKNLSPVNRGSSGIAWTYPFAPLNEYAGQTVQVAFRLGVDDSFFSPGNGPGWYIDDVRIYNEVLGSIPNTNLFAAEPWSFAPRVVGTGYTFVLSNAPSGMAVDTNGVLTWSPTEAQGPRVYSDITLRVIQPGNLLTPVAAQSFDLTANFGTNTPAHVAITYPPDDSVFTAPVDVVINVTATDPDDVITQVLIAADAAPLAVLTNSPYSFVWSNAPLTTNLIRAIATVVSGGASITVTSAPVRLAVSLAPPGPPVFSMSSTAYAVPESAGSVTVTVLKSPNSLGGTVNFTTANGSAVATTGEWGDYDGRSGSLLFTPSQISQTITVPILDDPSSEGNQQFTFILTDVVGGIGSLGSPASATITIIDDDPPGTTNSFLERINPGAVPPHTGQLRVSLHTVPATDPAQFHGQWRVLGELGWHDSDFALSGLSSGNYEIECKPVPGFLQPSNRIVPVKIEAPNSVAISYLANGAPGLGSLMVIIQPDVIAESPVATARGQWRVEGETLWHDSRFILTNLSAGSVRVEFKSVSDWTAPLARSIVVEPNQNNVFAFTYLVANPPIGSSPALVNFSNVQSPAFGLAYAFNGQLFSELGYGSGCVVKRRVVLTAAHVVFDDTTLSFVPDVQWMFQRNAANPGAPESYEPPPQHPRGWYVFDGYASARRDDNSPGVSSPRSQNLDVAALYFLENAGRGGQSGYLVSEPGRAEWLQASADKALIGYPVEIISEINRGRMHATLPLNLNFVPVLDRVFVTTDIHGYPGMSGGPLCVQSTNGIFYPAGIYLGGSGQATVRSIDGAIADLINRAEVSSYTGDNNTGGGVIRISPISGGGSCGGTLTVFIEPKSARDAGAKFQFISTNAELQIFANRDWASEKTIALGKDSFAIQFSTNVPGFLAPEYRVLELNCSAHSAVTGFFQVFPPALTFLNATNLAISGITGTTYRIEFVDRLRISNQWGTLSTNTLTEGWNVIRGALPPPGSNRLFRARWLP